MPRDKCPHAKFYERAEWTQEKKLREKAASVGSVEEGGQKAKSKGKGAARANNGENVSFPYLTDIAGAEITGTTTLVIRNFLYKVFNQMVDLGMAVARFSDGGQQFTEYIARELRAKFVWFRYCQFDWKALKAASDVYWAWHASRGKKMIAAHLAGLKTESDVDDEVADRLSAGTVVVSNSKESSVVPAKDVASARRDADDSVSRAKRPKHTHPRQVRFRCYQCTTKSYIRDLTGLGCFERFVSTVLPVQDLLGSTLLCMTGRVSATIAKSPMTRPNKQLAAATLHHNPISTHFQNSPSYKSPTHCQVRFIQVQPLV